MSCKYPNNPREEPLHQLVSTFKDDAPLETIVDRWHQEFSLGRRSIQDKYREGRPISVALIDSVYELIKLTRPTCDVLYCDV